jgi:hypothetical protein
MLLSDGDRLVIIASLQWAAMEHSNIARVKARTGEKPEAEKAAAFAGECARVADLIERAG